MNTFYMTHEAIAYKLGLEEREVRTIEAQALRKCAVLLNRRRVRRNDVNDSPETPFQRIHVVAEEY